MCRRRSDASERTALVNTGSANIDFELNQNATSGWDASTVGDVTINRTAGDLLITYDFSGSGTPTIGLLSWVTTGADSQCFASGGKVPCWGNHVDMTATGFAEAGVNTATESDPILGADVGAGLFGEASINLSSAHTGGTRICRRCNGERSRRSCTASRTPW